MSSSEPERVFDQYLVALAQGGSREAFGRLVVRWTPRLRRFAARTIGRSEVTGDIVQETWLAAIRGLRSLRDPARFPGWIYGIAHRKCIDTLRADQRRRSLASYIGLDGATPASVVVVEGRADDQLDLAVVLSRLSEEHRVVVQLFYGEDLGVGEIAAALAVPVGTVKSRLFHARQLLRKQIGE